MVDEPREPPETTDIDAGWDLEDAGEEPLPSTVGVESLELLARAGMAPAPGRVAPAAEPGPDASADAGSSPEPGAAPGTAATGGAPPSAPRSQKPTPVPGSLSPVTASSPGAPSPPATPPRPAGSAPGGRLPLRPPPSAKGPPPKKSTATTARALPQASALKQASRSDKQIPAQAGLRRPTARKLTPLVRDAAERAKRLDQRATLPPPVPTSEYVSTMMGQLEGERPPPTIPSEVRAAKLAALSEDDATPLIETVEEVLDGIDPDLLRDTPVPPPPGAGDPDLVGEADLARTREVPAADSSSLLAAAENLSALDDLPVDAVLGDLSARSDRATPVPGADDEPSPGSSREPGVPLAISDFPLDGGGMALPAPDELDPVLQPVEERFSVGDYSGALVLAEGLLEEHADHPQILRYVESCQDMLRQMYMSKLGDGSDIPRLAMESAQLRRLTLDHRAGFLLSCIDGSCSIDEVLDVAMMPPLEAVRTLYELVLEGVVEICPSSGRR